MIQKVILVISAIYFIALVALGVVTYQASPGPTSQEILGVGIGGQSNMESIVYLSGRRLLCIPIEGTQQFAMTCSIELAGQRLEIQAQRNPSSAPNQFGGVCQAFYNGQSWPCTIGSRHVHVNWFAYLPSMGLSSAQLATLHNQYPVENQPEAVFLASLLLVPLVTAAVVVLLVISWDSSRAKHNKRWILRGLVAGVVSLVGTWIVWFFLANPFWD